MAEPTASQQIDEIIRKQSDWRGAALARARALITAADADVVEEVKWKKPSKPEGSAVWSHAGIVCVADILKLAVRLTFPKGAQVDDPTKLFNARLDSKSVRAIDFHQNEPLDEVAFKALFLAAAALNTSKGRSR